MFQMFEDVEIRESFFLYSDDHKHMLQDVG